MPVVSVHLGDFWQASLTVAMCPNLRPLDIGLTDDQETLLTGLTVSNGFQNITVRAGPLYFGDMSDIDVHIPASGYIDTYPSVFSILIEGMPHYP